MGTTRFFRTTLTFVGFALLLLNNSYSNNLTTLETRIQGVIDASQPGQRHQVMSTADGRVYELSRAQLPLHARVKEAQRTHRPVRLSIVNDEVIAVDWLSQAGEVRYESTHDGAAAAEAEAWGLMESYLPPNAPPYNATVMASMDEAARVFDGMRTLKWKSQCFQRAHVWAMDMSWAGYRTMKVFLFFTRKFISEYRYKWWFHVAPFTYVSNGTATPSETVLDPQFLDNALPMQEWTDHFMSEGGLGTPYVCAEVAKYQDYEQNQWSAYCYTRKVPMYYYQPVDLEALDDPERHVVVTEFRQWDANNARRAIP